MLEQAAELLGKQVSPLTRGLCSVMIAQDAFLRGEYVRSVTVMDAAFACISRIRSLPLRSIMYDSRASAALYLGDYRVCIQYALLAIESARGAGREDLVAVAYCTLANAYCSLGEEVQGVHYLEQAVQTQKKHGTERQLATALMNLAAIQRARGLLTEHNSNVERADSIFRKVTDVVGQASVEVARGNGYMDAGRMDDAIVCFRSAYALASQVMDNNDAAVARLNEALLLVRTNRVRQGLTLARNTLATFKDLDHHRFASNAHQVIAYAQYCSGAMQSCVTHLRQALDISVRLDAKRDCATIAHALYEVYSERGDLVHALEFYKKYHSYSIQVVTKDKEASPTQHALVASAEDALRRASEAHDAAVELQNRIHERDRELQQTALRLARDHEFIASIRRIVSQALHNPHQSVEALDSIDGMFREFDASDQAWAMVERQLTLAHGALVADLQQRLPHLSKAEFRVCVLAKIGLSAKETADVLFLSVRTIENHRFRVRKKLGLSGETDLQSVL